MNPYIWCVVGGVVGLIAGLMTGNGDRIVMIENVAVGIFGAFIGGDFIVAMLNKGVVNDADFHISSLGIAVASAVVFLGLLKLMRRAVGPMQASKGPRRRD